MDKQHTPLTRSPLETNKIYVALVGSAPMASLDALMLSLDRFRSILNSDSAKDRFETTVRTIKSSLNEVDQFIDAVYSEKNPKLSVNMTGRTLIIEAKLNKDTFLELINDGKVDGILKHVVAVGTMPAKKSPSQAMREYISFPVKFEKGQFVKTRPQATESL